MAAGRSPFSEVPPKTNCQPRGRPSRALHAARMETSAPGAEVARCMFVILDNAILQGRPHFPRDLVEVSGVIKEHHVRSSTLTHGSARCPAGSGCRTLKTPGEPSIRCCLWPEHHIARARSRAACLWRSTASARLRKSPSECSLRWRLIAKAKPPSSSSPNSSRLRGRRGRFSASPHKDANERRPQLIQHLS